MSTRSLLLVCFMLIAACALSQITVLQPGPWTVCQGSTIPVDYDAVGAFNAGNVFTMELSDASGSFGSPTVVGSLLSTTSGTIATTIPTGLPLGSYLLRVVSSDPMVVGSDGPFPVFMTIPPDAGSNSVLTLCSSDAPMNMWSIMNGSPEPGGTWTSPAGNPQPSVFTPGVSMPGCYTYTVPGESPCPNDVASMCVTVMQAPDAGVDGSFVWCTSAGVIDLSTQLVGSPDPGGTWIDDDTTGQLMGSIFNAPAAGPGTYNLTYMVNGMAPCAPATSTLTVTVAACLTNPGQANYEVE